MDTSHQSLLPSPDSVRFIPEQVATADQFQHRSVAKVIARAVVRHPHLRTIGLLGRWGSGKSSTINFVPSEVEELTDEPCLVFTYDAWLYQSDAPRPAFIDALFEFLVKQGRLSRADWNDHIAMLTGHLQVTYSSERPFTSATSRAMLVAALGAPLALILANHQAIISDQWPFWTEGRAALATVVLTVLPALVWVASKAGKLCALSWSRLFSASSLKADTPEDSSDVKRRRGPRVASLDPRFAPKPTNESWSWILSRKPQASEQRKIGKATPSTADFQSAFQSMVKAAFEHGEGRLVIAVDNLDRLPIAEAVALWAVIRSFFLGGSSTSTPVMNRLTILLPMDADYVAQVQGATSPYGTSRSDAAQGLMEKTFDLTLRLPRPAFVDWQGYFRKQLAYAFYRASDDADMRNIGTVLNDAWRYKSDEITPRMINAMVNRIVAMWLRWETEDIDLLVVASYAIRQDEIDADLSGYLSRPNILANSASATWQQWIAAMHFGIPPKQAIGLLLNGRINEAIDQHDVDQFRALADYTAFPELLRTIVDSFGQSTPDIRILKTADLLAKVPLRGAVERHHVEAVLARTFLDCQSTGQVEEEHIPGLQALLTARVLGVAPDALINHFVQRVALAMTQSYPGRHLLERFFEEITPVKDELGVKRPLVVSAEPMMFFDVADIAWDFEDWLAVLRTDNDTEVMASLVGMLVQPVRGADVLFYVWKSSVQAPWTRVIEVLTDGLEGRTAIPLATLGLGFGLLRQSEPSARQALNLQKRDRLPAAIIQATNSGDMVAAGRLLSLALLEDDVPVMSYPWTTQGPDSVETLVETIELSLRSFGTAEDTSINRLSLLAQRSPDLAGLMARVFPRLAHGPQANELDTLVPHLGFYRSAAQLGDFTTLVKGMLESPTFWLTFQDWLGDDAWLVLRTMQDQQLVPVDRARGAVLQRLLSIPSAQWVELISQGGLPYDALIGQTAPDVALPELVSALGTLISQLPERPDALNRWSAAARKLREIDRIEVSGRLARALLEPEYLGIAGASLIHMPEIAQSDAFRDRPDVALRHVTPGLITSSAAHEDIVHAARLLIPVVQRATMETQLKLQDDLRSSASVSNLHNTATTIEVLWNEVFPESNQDSAP